MPARIDSSQFSRRTDLVWVAGNACGLGATFIAAYLDPHDGLFWAYATVLSRLLLYAWAGRTAAIFRELLSMGLVAGVLELLADYMPFAWACVVVEFGYLLLRLAGALRRAWLASIVGGAVAGTAIGVYEFFAFRAGWWYYQPAHAMLGATCALYIPVGEFLMFSGFIYIFRHSESEPDWLRRALLRGTLFGIATFAAYAAAYAALELR